MELHTTIEFFNLLTHMTHLSKARAFFEREKITSALRSLDEAYSRGIAYVHTFLPESHDLFQPPASPKSSVDAYDFSISSSVSLAFGFGSGFGGDTAGDRVPGRHGNVGPHENGNATGLGATVAVTQPQMNPQPQKPVESHMSTIHQALSEIVTSSMICTDIIVLLTKHGCYDLTELLDQSACSRYPIANGGLGDVFYGRLRDGTPVAIKTIRSYHEPGQQARVYHKRAAKEIYTWSKCKHPNVAQLMGLAVFHDCLSMISRWEDNGSLLPYLLRHPAVDRCNLSISICAGLAYLHENDIVHGDLKGANILISQDGTPMLMDFGNASLLDATLQFTQTNTGPSFSLRWTPPEILEGTSSHTMAGDIYSLGMTILEAFTSEIPFAYKTEKSLLAHILFHKEMPTRPEKVIPSRSIDGDKLWSLLTDCWSYNPEDRPSADAFWNNIRLITSDNLKEIEGYVEGRSGDKIVESEKVSKK
ncbi:unnamed protein product [Rhizoctonia solani]|uniref:Protein kinase domain-containing protein n=1 Tax=Rhizoctonia solani TaxID=456999 RepID=A0A8H3HAD6_9AGAM|nr:unnamed protein product [Rhizoctonia solani]CAE6491862.1 unnamed protein product [Rhizoctonia solani]